MTARKHKRKVKGEDAVLGLFSNSIGMKMKLIPAGAFMMGSPDSDDMAFCDEKPQHEVEITSPFYLGIYPVTQAEWEKVMGNNLGCFEGERRPVKSVSWDDCQEFIKRLNAMEGTERYRLPTEAEWEYACRAGSQGRWCFGDDESELERYAWYDKNSGEKTHPLGELKPNAWGLYDMHGNVWEWCRDWYDGDFISDWHNTGFFYDFYDTNYYENSPRFDPVGILDGSYRVFRGGSWDSNAKACRSASRGYGNPVITSINIGFRLLREVD